jgi:hypothetical protein
VGVGWCGNGRRRLCNTSTVGAIAALDDWLALTDLVATHAPELLDRFRFPDAQTPALRTVIEATPRTVPELDVPGRTLLARVLERIARLVPGLTCEAAKAASALARRKRRRRQGTSEPQLRQLSPELEQLLSQPLASERNEHLIVARVLRDL